MSQSKANKKQMKTKTRQKKTHINHKKAHFAIISAMLFKNKTDRKLFGGAHPECVSS